MQQEIKNLRVTIDGLAQLTKDLKGYKRPIEMFVTEETSSDEVRRAVDSLYLAKAWLGKVLGEIGTENPYKSGYKTKEDIEPTADVSLPITLKVQLNETKPIGASTRDMNHIEKVDWLRTEIQKIINNTEDFSEVYPHIELEQGFVYKYLCEARFWLGFELGRVKNE